MAEIGTKEHKNEKSKDGRQIFLKEKLEKRTKVRRGGGQLLLPRKIEGGARREGGGLLFGTKNP